MRPLLLLLGLIFALAERPLPAFGQSEFPEVYVDVTVSAELYRTVLPADLPDIENDLTEAIVRHLDGLGGLDFIIWKAGPAPSETNNHRLHVQIEGIDRLLGTEIRARFFGFVAGTALTDLSEIDQEGKIALNPIVFDAVDEKFAQDPARLVREIDRWMEETLTDHFGTVLTRKFLGHIPLALITPPTPLLELDAGTNRIPLPIRYSSYFPEDTTQFKAAFTSSSAGFATQGQMFLRPTGTLDAPGFVDDMLVAISCAGEGQRCFDYPNVEIDPEDEIGTQQWASIRKILSNDHLKELQLFMVHYRRRPFANTNGGLIIEEMPGLPQ
jgi:hypothetical protein